MADAQKPLRLPVLHEDGRARCAWPGVDPLYVAYHDAEWGVPEYDSRALFEKLLLDGFQIDVVRTEPGHGGCSLDGDRVIAI